ncbi:hypothetical protein [Clostridium sp. LS]|nr:hypothetical protein [Clostridium sp. LS]
MNHSFVPVPKEFLWVILRQEAASKMLASKASFELAYLEQLLV